MYQAVVFDFDGTLVDSESGIIRTLEAMLKELGRSPLTKEQLRACVGPPIHKFFPETLGFQEHELEKAIEIFKRLFQELALSTLKPFDGIVELLQDLQNSGTLTCVATCKTEIICYEQAQALGLLPHLDYISGAKPEVGQLDKGSVLRALIDKAGLDVSRCVMVGDRMYDILGAHEVNMKSIGVLYGSGSYEELKAYEPEQFAKSVADLRVLLESKFKEKLCPTSLP